MSDREQQGGVTTGGLQEHLQEEGGTDGQRGGPAGVSPGILQRKIQRRALQRKAASDGAGGGAPAESGPGAPLPNDVKTKMEGSFGADFSSVRVHEGNAAAAVGARAFTQGSDIHFAAGQYDPHGRAGQELLGHELSHVVQQGSGRVATTMQGKDAPIVEDAALEREADVQGERAARGEAATTDGARALSPGGGAVQRKAEEGAQEGGKGGETTEKLGGTLWAKDEKGNDLPPSIADISQGGVNDCFLFAAMAGIVNADPERIKNMIKDNGNGTYTVTFAGIGFWKAATQTVSADFVVGRHGNVKDRKALWPLIIEKAYAAQKGGLDNLDKGGNAGNAMDDLTNDGTTRFDPRDKTGDYILGKLAKAKEKKQAAVAHAPKKEGSSKEKKEMADNIKGLYFWHAYTILDIDANGKRVNLFNPWGHDHPNGDGWLSVEDFKKFFVEVDING